MTTVLVFAIACAVVILSAVFLFRENSRSAVALARHNLFKSRDRLFDIAQAGLVGFDQPGYQAAREMINSFIRYAHDLSLTQLLLTRFLRRVQRLPRKPAADWDRAIESLPKAAKPLVKAIIDETIVTMFRLMVTRSILLSAVVALIVSCHALGVCFRVLMHSVKVNSRQSVASVIVYEEMLSHRPGLRFGRVVKQEAKGYRAQRHDLFANAA